MAKQKSKAAPAAKTLTVAEAIEINCNAYATVLLPVGTEVKLNEDETGYEVEGVAELLPLFTEAQLKSFK